MVGRAQEVDELVGVEVLIVHLGGNVSLKRWLRGQRVLLLDCQALSRGSESEVGDEAEARRGWRGEGTSLPSSHPLAALQETLYRSRAPLYTGRRSQIDRKSRRRSTRPPSRRHLPHRIASGNQSVSRPFAHSRGIRHATQFVQAPWPARSAGGRGVLAHSAPPKGDNGWSSGGGARDTVHAKTCMPFSLANCALTLRPLLAGPRSPLLPLAPPTSQATSP